MKIMTLVGTRPELIRLCILIEKLDKLVDHIFVYTNQNYDYNLSGKFFEELKIREPNYYLENKGFSIAKFLSNSLPELEKILIEEKPDKLLVLGDTNSGLLALLANKMSIPVYHMEAGNRCYDDRVPEETNRRIIDSLSTYNLPYTENSKQNLLNSGYDKNHVFKTGNPIYEVLNKFESEIDCSNILSELVLPHKEFVLVTAHRAENVNSFGTLKNIINALNYISTQYKVVFSVHPRTKQKIFAGGIEPSDKILMSEPFGFFDFVKLERTAKVAISDSGTVQEECCIFGVPSITIRNSTERQETIECGSNVLVGTDTATITATFDAVISRDYTWDPPQDYLIENVSDTVVNILLGR